jgi:hypothetical protein
MTTSRQAFPLLFGFMTLTMVRAQSSGTLVECPLCSDPTYTPQDPFARFVSGTETLTCESAFDLGTLLLPLENCTFWQSRGDLICQCAAAPLEANDCSLCESGDLPEPLKEAVPGKVCAAVEVDAKQGSPDLCVVYQQTIGVYCGCENQQNTTNITLEVCRLCGGDMELQFPLAPVAVVDQDGKDTKTSCVELEFAANVPGANCQEFQDLHGQSICCETAAPTPAPFNGAAPFSSYSVLGMAMVGVLALLGV